MDIETIGEAVALARKHRRITQAQIAKQLGMSRSTISGIENGTISEIGIRKMLNLCDALGLELNVVTRATRPTMQQLIREQRDD